MINDTFVYTEPNFKEDTTVAYYFEIELKNGTNYIARHFTNIFEIYKVRPNWTPESLFHIHFGPNSTTSDWKKSDPNVFYMDDAK